MREISPIDAKILKDLLKDGRKSFTQIANECGETKVTIFKRFKEMEKLGIIIGSTIQLDYASLGFNTVGDIAFRAPPENIERFITNFQRIPNIYGAYKLNKNTVDVIATLRNVKEFDRLKEIIKAQPTVTDVVTNIWMGIRNMPYNLSLTDNGTALYTEEEGHGQKDENNALNIDIIEHKIIEKLAVNGRTPFISIAKELGISTNTVIRKYEKLKQNGVISVSIQINPLKLGYKAEASFNLAIQSSGNLLQVVDNLSAIPDVTLMVKTSGKYELSVSSFIRNVTQIVDLKDKIFEVADVSKWEMFVDRLWPCFPSSKQYISTF